MCEGLHDCNTEISVFLLIHLMHFMFLCGQPFLCAREGLHDFLWMFISLSVVFLKIVHDVEFYFVRFLQPWSFLSSRS